MGIQAAFMVPHPPLIIPDIGQGQEQQIQDTVHAYERVAKRIAKLQPETIIVISPHQTIYGDYFHISPGSSAKGNFSDYQAGHVKMKAVYDEEFVECFCSLTGEEDVPAGILGEKQRHLDHGTMIPLYFINQYWERYKLVRVGLSGLPYIKHYELGQCIRKAIDTLDRKTVVIASGDLSHRLKAEGPYGFSEEGPLYDARVMEVMGNGAFGELLEFSEEFCEKAGECGHRAFCILAGVLDKTDVVADRLSYEGPFGVGYGVCGFAPYGKNTQRNFKELYEEKERTKVERMREKEDAYVHLARKTIEQHVHTGKKLEVPPGLPEELYAKGGGVFVSIKEDGMLRGCIGTIQAEYPSVAEEIIENAVSASLRDPRFPPIEPTELDKLTVTVDVLGEIERIESPKELDAKKYGVIVSKGHKRGLLLPNLDGIDTVEKQIITAKQKAGIDVDADVVLERFEVERHF